MDEYMQYMSSINTMSDNIYRYLNFNEIEDFMEAAERAKNIPLTNIQDVAWTPSQELESNLFSKP